ncbi:MAG: valine--tRNA ligase, partial [Bacilli bacterium]
MLEKKYDHLMVEKGKYENWVNKGYFEEQNESKVPYCIVIPPPNVTGKLHLGHAWDTTLQDILIRFKRMQGFNAVWIPGMDHAGIATQAKVDAKLKSMGMDPRGMEREKWLSYAWDWKSEYAKNIHEQWAKLGLSLCFSKERFTLDEGLNKAVNHVFKTLYDEGLIYRGERIINWDPEAMTALSNEEVIYKEVDGAFYHIKYFLEGSDDFLEVATTRPETLFGDTAVAVNKNDERYKKYIGKNVVLPLVNKLIPVISDDHADMDFGTGVVKITPAHDPLDFEVGVRHNLERICVINPNGVMNENALKYNGMDRFVARDAIVEDLKLENLIIKIDAIKHNVGHSERTNVMIEPYLSKQWFVKMRPLADKVLENQKNKDTKVNFVPERYEKIMNHWMEITYDWCISRQLWWGHRIPAWYKGDEVFVGDTAPDDSGWVQDNDVLDTWFSSALWPFSVLGWPEVTNDLKKFYPNNVLVTGYDIIPFWVNRMTFQGLHFTHERPFKDCLIHGLIRDKDGRKMSKSLGNGIDPMDVCEKYGTDALRFFLATSTSPGMDLRYDEEKVKSTWNFINKLWNASRFVLSNIEDLFEENYTLDNLTLEDKWILTNLNNTIKNVTKNMEKYEFNNVGSEIYNFSWNLFCDNYIEMSKHNIESLTTKSVLLKVLSDVLKMLHPFMPYVTDEIYSMLPIKTKENIMISDYPIYNKDLIFNKETEVIDEKLEFIKIFRNVKLENKITNDCKVRIVKDNNYDLIIKILKLKDNLINEEINKTKFKVSYKEYEMDIYFEQVLSDEQKSLKIKAINDLELSIKRRKSLLENVNYVKNAPIEIVEKER